MTRIKWLLTITCCLLINLAFCIGPSAKALDLIKSINVYFPGTELSSDGSLLNINVQGTTVAVPLCHVDLSKPDDHNINFASNDKDNKIMRGQESTTSVTLLMVHGNTRIFDLLQSLHTEVCGK
jgi:hypothetical protein